MTHLPHVIRILRQFACLGTDVEKNARDPYGDGDQRRLKGFSESIAVTCVIAALRLNATEPCYFCLSTRVDGSRTHAFDTNAQFHREIWAGGEISSLLLNRRISPDSFAMHCITADSAACAAQASSCNNDMYILFQASFQPFSSIIS